MREKGLVVGIEWEQIWDQERVRVEKTMMPEDQEVFSASALELGREVERGLPLSALDDVVHKVAPDDGSFAYRLVPRATLSRRRRGLGETQARLSPDEGARVARLARVWELAREVWKSDEATREFLFRPNMVLDMQRPVDVALANEFGGAAVMNLLGGLLYGTAV